MRMTTGGRKIEEYDASVLVGLRTIVLGAAVEYVDEDGDTCIELPKLPGMLATAAMVRCLGPARLRGSELKAIRRIMGITLADMAEKLGEKTSPQTISRWESEAQPMGGYAEKCFRLLVCESLKDSAPGVTYNASMIAQLKQVDPWKANPDYELAPIIIEYARIKESSGEVIDAWDAKLAA